MSASSDAPSTGELLEIVLVSADLMHLVLLLQGDGLAGAADDEAREDLRQGISDATERATHRARRLSELLTEHRVWANQQIADELGEGGALSAGDRTQIERMLGTRGADHARAVLDAMGRVADAGTDDQGTVACDLLVGVVGGGLLTCFKTVGTGCLVAGMGAGLALALC